MRHKTTYISLIAASFAMLALAGCQRESLITADNAIRYKVTVADIATKGTLVNNNDNSDYSDIVLASTLSPFCAAAYNGTTTVFDTEGLDPAGVETVSYASGSWTMPNTYYWPLRTELTFFAWGNLSEEGSSVTASSTGLTLDHEMVQDVADQKDILLGYYKGRGVSGNTAEIRFRHPLTAVIFREGDLGGEKVTSITLEGLAVSGSVTMDADGIIGAWDVDDYTTTSSQSDSEGLAVNTTTKIIGDPFILIPQDLATNSVQLTVTCKSGLTFETTIESGEWKAQKTNWYTLNYGATTNWTLTVTPWDEGESGDISAKDADFVFEVSEDSHAFFNTTSREVATIDVTSEMSAGGNPMGNVEWTIKSYQIGTSEPAAVGGASFTAGGLTAEVTGDGKLKLTAAARSLMERPDLHDYWVNQNPVRTDRFDWSPEDWTSATASSPIDLSKFNPYTDTQNAYGMTTANCYIIRHAGTYKLPLVYGNAVVDGVVNEQSYYPDCIGDVTGGENRLDHFQNHLDNGITSAFIENNMAGVSDYISAGKCAILWQDKAEVVKNLQIVGDQKTDGTYDASSVRYLQFTVDNSTVCQNNALICIYNDADSDGSYDPGEAIWSWHIWTTNNPALLENPISVTNNTTPAPYTYSFFPIYNLGWIDTSNYPGRQDVKIVLAQSNSGNEIEITVRQNSVTMDVSNGCYYQWGRKDPMPTSDVSGFTSNISGGTTLGGSIASPATFFNGNTLDWLTGTHYYNLWTGKKSEAGLSDQDNDMIKTIYDPSPVGYKIPASNAGTSFTTTGGNTSNIDFFNVEGDFNNGWHFYTDASKISTAFFATALYRDHSDGEIIKDDVLYGRYWTATPEDGDKAYRIGFNPGSVNPVSNGNRAAGFSVRPVLE